MSTFLLFLSSYLLLTVHVCTAWKSNAPTVKVLNGTYHGLYSAQYNQDFFLGMPYAQPPLGDLRFNVPYSLNTTWQGSRSAVSYSQHCVGYGGDQIGYEQGEDCLSINVVRPSNVGSHSRLPVGTWIHGGGWIMGGSGDKRYNLSFIVENAEKLGMPFIGVSFNYRLSIWGLINGVEVRGTGNTNIALRDQRLALQWVQDNIAAFGGDPRKVTIWGESAGGTSVGAQLQAYAGRNDKLFRAAIMESGDVVQFPNDNGAQAEQGYVQLLNATGCYENENRLQCLRHVPFKTLNGIWNSSAFNTLPSGPFSNPYIDGDVFLNFGSTLLKSGRFVRVPILHGTNTDEGSAFGPQGINTEAQFRQFLLSSTPEMPALVADKLLKLYPDDPCVGIPASAGCNRLPSQGFEFRRTSAYVGDVMEQATRRLGSESYAARGLPVYSYRFNAIPAGVPSWLAATHFQEVAFVFLNTLGVGYAFPPPFYQKPQSFFDLAKLMSSMWAGFIVDLDPNAGVRSFWKGQRWPVYDNGHPQEFVFDANVTSHVGDDTYRKAAIDYINSIQASVYHR